MKYYITVEEIPTLTLDRILLQLDNPKRYTEKGYIFDNEEDYDQCASLFDELGISYSVSQSWIEKQVI